MDECFRVLLVYPGHMYDIRAVVPVLICIRTAHVLCPLLHMLLIQGSCTTFTAKIRQDRLISNVKTYTLQNNSLFVASIEGGYYSVLSFLCVLSQAMLQFPSHNASLPVYTHPPGDAPPGKACGGVGSQSTLHRSSCKLQPRHVRKSGPTTVVWIELPAPRRALCE